MALFFLFGFDINHPLLCPQVPLPCITNQTSSTQASDLKCYFLKNPWGFPNGSVAKNLPASAGDVGSIPGLGRSPGKGNGNSDDFLSVFPSYHFYSTSLSFVKILFSIQSYIAMLFNEDKMKCFDSEEEHSQTFV